MQRALARQAAIDRTYARYIKLVCGEYITLEDDMAMSVWRPRKGVCWCDKHDAWEAVAKPPKPPDYGDTPPF